MKTGIVLEGGAMRGLFSAGVTDVMMENGIEADGLIGVSAGAAFGCNYKSRQNGRAVRYNLRFCKEPRYCSFRSLLKTGDLYGADFCYRLLPKELDPFDSAAFDKNPMEFYVVATDAMTGKPVYRLLMKDDPICTKWIQASASMPVVSRPVEVEGYTLLDGGIADSIPLNYFESIGYNRNLVVLTQPAGYEKKKSSALPLMKLLLGKYPNVAKAMEKRHLAYNEATQYVAKAEKEGRALVIRPDAPLPVGRVEHDADKLRQAYQLGRQAGEKNLDAIRAFFAKEALEP